MKKILNIIGIFASILLLSCVPEEDLIFDDSASNRVDAALKETQEILVSAPNGWHMVYYPAAQQSYGGYNLLLSFTDDEVTVSAEVNYSDDTSTGLYSLKQSAGPVLTLDTYNDNFHFFSTPDSDVSGVGSDGVGMGGDFEFLIMKATPDSVVLKGRKTTNKIVMTPMQEDTQWEDYLNDIQDASDKMGMFPMFEFHVNGKVIPVSISYRTLSFTYTNDENQEVTVRSSYIQTPTGYVLYEPLTIEGVTITEFVYNEGDPAYFTAKEDSSVRLVVVYPPLNEQLVSGDWYFSYSGLGAYGKVYWDYTKVNGLDALGEQLYYAYLGSYSGRYGFGFGSLAGSSLYLGVLHYNYVLEGEDQVTYSFAGTGADNGVWYHNNAAFAYLLTPVAYSSSRTFTLTADNTRTPTWITLTDDSEPNNTITLYKSPVIFPYDN